MLKNKKNRSTIDRKPSFVVLVVCKNKNKKKQKKKKQKIKHLLVYRVLNESSQQEFISHKASLKYLPRFMGASNISVYGSLLGTSRVP